MEQRSVPFKTQDYSNLFKCIFALFIIEYVKMEPPRPVNQTCPLNGCGTDRRCQDCWDLDDFLHHPSRHSRDLTNTPFRRPTHSYIYIDSPAGCCQGIADYLHCDTVLNRRVPHTLQVSKTLIEAWEANHLAWLSHCVQAGGELAAVGHDALRQPLGNKYNECIELRSVRHGLKTVIPKNPPPRTNSCYRLK